jgi:hypothetical protein
MRNIRPSGLDLHQNFIALSTITPLTPAALSALLAAFRMLRLVHQPGEVRSIGHWKSAWSLSASAYRRRSGFAEGITRRVDHRVDGLRFR